MSVATPESAEPGQGDATRRIRVVYRDASGKLHTDWSPGRLREAVDDAEGVVWVDILDPDTTAAADSEGLLRDVFGFHPLAIEDAVRETHLPRVDDWGDYLYIVFQSIDFDARSVRVKFHELDI